MYGLGAFLHTRLLLEEQMAALAWGWVGYAHFRVVHDLCLFLDQKALLTITHAFMSSHLDYCHTLYSLEEH